MVFSFIKGHSILIGIVGCAFFLTFFMTTYCRLENKRRDALGSARTGTESESDEEAKELADNVAWFRYTV